MIHCACGFNLEYDDCCGKYISGQESASTPEILMRSRYTAYTKAAYTYIARTMRPPAADHFDSEGVSANEGHVIWKALQVISTYEQNQKGFVEFKAFYVAGAREYVLHELSEFHFIDGEWFYVDGRTKTNRIKAGRNELCPCASGLKHKKCCGRN